MGRQRKKRNPSVRASAPRVRLIAIDLSRPKELAWLHQFILRHHSTPRQIMPSREDLAISSHRYFRAIGASPAHVRGKLIGISSYEIRTRFLAETQKTVVTPAFRGQGWGKAISQAIENQVRRDGFKKVRTTIYVDNLAMLGIKLSQGYTIEGFHPDHEAPGVHEYSLGKILK